MAPRLRRQLTAELGFGIVRVCLSHATGADEPDVEGDGELKAALAAEMKEAGR